MRIIDVSKEFTRYPGGRFKAKGDFSGEEFRENFLDRPISSEEKICINLNGLFTIPPSFLDESIGIIIKRVGKAKFDSLVTIVLTDDPAALHELNDIYQKRESDYQKSHK